MVLCISSHASNEMILEAINEAELNILNNIVYDEFDISKFLKQQVDQIQGVSILIIDLDAIGDNEEDFLQAIKTVRLLYNNIRIVIVAPNKSEGDLLLSEIFNLGIYDIIAFNDGEDNYLLKRNLIKSLKQGFDFKDSIHFKVVSKPGENKQQKIKEKVIIKKEVRQTVNKALIGFTGSQSRIGVTHNCIVSANYLKNKGYKVAIVENAMNESKCLESVKDLFDTDQISEECFSFSGIDFYTNFNLEQLHKIISLNYNFILIDFGVFDENYLEEFRRCVVQVIVTGSKSWELDHVNKIFKCVDEQELKGYTFLFNFTNIKFTSDLRESMEVCDKVYFSGYCPDPFNPDFYPDLDKIFHDYIPISPEIKPEKGSFLRRLFKK